MCTAIKFLNYFGRNLDLEYNFNEEVVITPRNYCFNFSSSLSNDKNYALIGIATKSKNYPLYYDAINEYGLGGVGLSFNKQNLYSNNLTVKNAIAPYEFLPFVLRTSKTIKEVKNLLKNHIVVNKSFSKEFAVTNMHFMFADKNSSIVIETNNGKINIYNNKLNILTNMPEFYNQIKNLNNYKRLTNKDPYKSEYKGSGAVGLPGDYTSVSRFVKTDFILKNSAIINKNNNELTQFFKVLDSVFVPLGAVNINNKFFHTIYTTGYNLKDLTLCFKTYNNNRISQVSMLKENLDLNKLICYPINNKQDILYLN